MRRHSTAATAAAAKRQIQKYLQFTPNSLESQFFQWSFLPSNQLPVSAGSTPNSPQQQQTIDLHSQVQIRKSPQKGYDLVSLSYIPKETEILTVPSEYWQVFSAQTATQSLEEDSPTLYQKLQQPSKTLLSNPSPSNTLNETLIRSFSLAFYLAMHSTPQDVEPSPDDEINASIYFQFLRHHSYPMQAHLLPHTLSFNATNASSFSLNSLEGLKLHRDIMIRKNMYERLAMHLIGVDSPQHALVQDFLWAMGIVLSRALSSPHIPFTMIPILDFANHGDDSVTSCPSFVTNAVDRNILSSVNIRHHYNPQSESFSLVTERDIYPQESLCINYGPTRDTSSFVTLYGFLGNYYNNQDKVLLKLNQFQAWKCMQNPQLGQQVLQTLQKMMMYGLRLDQNTSGEEGAMSMRKLLDMYQLTVSGNQISILMPLFSSSAFAHDWSAEEIDQQRHGSLQILVWFWKLLMLKEGEDAVTYQDVDETMMMFEIEDWKRVGEYLDSVLSQVYVNDSKFDAFGFKPSSSSLNLFEQGQEFLTHLHQLSERIRPQPTLLNAQGEVMNSEEHASPLSAMEYWKSCCARVVEREVEEILALQAMIREQVAEYNQANPQ